MRRFALALAVLLSITPSAFAADAKSAFPGFCEEWMGKLAARQKRNEGQIDWQNQGANVFGTYVGYSNQHTCVLKGEDGPAPIGKITYLEVVYEKAGNTRDEASASSPKPVETTEVTEIFRYANGKWIY